MIEVVEGTRAVPAKVYAAIVRAQAVAAAVEKASRNEFQRYQYASADDVIAEGKRALTTADLGVFPIAWEHVPAKATAAPDGDGYIEEPGRIRVTYRLVHASGEWLDFDPFSTPVIPEKGRPEDKAEATSLTYNLGYFLRGLLLIARVDAPVALDDAPVDHRDDRHYEPRKAPKPEAKPAKSSAPSPAADFVATPASITVTAAIESAMRSAKSEAQLTEAVAMTIDAANERRINRVQYDALRATCARVRAERKKEVKEAKEAGAVHEGGGPEQVPAKVGNGE